jgi:hypothetical protein
MTTIPDPLTEALFTFQPVDGVDGPVLDSRDRLAFATGRLLSADDLNAEQSYHRGRVARALAALHGSGTIAGLLVEYQAATSGDPTTEQILIHPGLALDRLGRLLEVPRTVCLRLGVWYGQQQASDLRGALKGAPFNGVVADIFLQFAVCPRANSPAFATGPFDATDAVQPSRLRDMAEPKLVPRQEDAAALATLVPRDQWPDLSTIGDPSQRRTLLHNAIWNAWPTDAPSSKASPEPALEYPPNQDTTSVFLARVIVPAAAGATPNAPPTRQPGPVSINNDLRLFVYHSRALAHFAGL